MHTDIDVAISGAGLGGLVTALAMHQRGFRPVIYEQAPALSEVGAGVQLSANAVRVLFDLGLEEELLAVASLPGGKQVRLWNTGEAWKLFDLGSESEKRYGYPYLMMHRADLHEVLRSALDERAPDSLRLDHRLVDIHEADDRVRLRFADDRRSEADVLVGADGVHSVVRNHLFGDDRPTFTGCVAWRGVVRSDDLPERLVGTMGTNWIGPHGHVIHYPLRGGQLVNFVGIVERDDWDVESWNTRGTTEECAADFAGWHPDVLTLIHAIEVPMKWALMLRRTLPTWSSGRSVLLGDACHPTLPFLAQGACMAIEDGLVLARALEHHPDAPSAFAAYEAARVPRATAVVDGSAANLSRFHNPILADPLVAPDYVAAEWAGPRVEDRYDWLFRHDATTVVV